MPRAALPSRDEMEHVDTLCCLTIVFTLLTAQLYLEYCKYWVGGEGVFDADEASVEIDRGSESGDSEEASGSDDE